MPQGPTPNPEQFHPPGPWGAAGRPTQQPSGEVSLTQNLDVPFISSATILFAPDVLNTTVFPGFIASSTTVHALALDGPGAQICFDSSTTWLCPDGYYAVKIEAWGGGGGGGGNVTGGLGGVTTGSGHGGGGGGAFASNYEVPVTPGVTYTITVGAAGAPPAFDPAPGIDQNPGGDGGDSSFVGDGGTTVLADGGKGGGDTSQGLTAGAGGLAASSTGLTTFSGGSGGAGATTNTTGGAGGGEAAGPEGNGDNGDNSISGNVSGQPGGSGATSGGDGGRGGDRGNPPVTAPVAGSAPGGGGGGSGALSSVAGAAGATGRICLTFTRSVTPDFIASTTQIFAPDLATQIYLDFIASSTTLFALTVEHAVADTINLPFIASETTVLAITVTHELTGVGPGNGGETWSLQLAPSGVTETAILAVNISAGASSLTLTGDGPFPDTGGFCVTIDDEVLWIAPTGGGSYSIGLRGLSNTPAAAHTAGATVSWDDSYLMAVESTVNIAADYYDPAQPIGGIGGDPTIGTDFPMPMPIAFETHGLENNDYAAGALATQLIAAGFRSVALQLDGATLGGRPHSEMIADMALDANTLKSFGLYVIAWSATVYGGMEDDINAIGADGVVYQVEGPGQRDDVITAAGANVHGGRPVAAITNYGGIDTVSDGGLLRAAGVTALCPEVYAADGHSDITAILAAGASYGFDLQQMCPTLGTYAGEVPSDYTGFDADVIPNFGIWSTAQTSAAAYDELEALNDGSPPPDPDTESNFVRYPGWLISFDSSQAYLGGNRYSTYVKELLGVFPRDTGQSGTSKLDGPQPVAEGAPEGTTDNCPCGIGVPARIQTDIRIGDVALCRYTNEEASILTLGPRATSLQSWYGMKRVSDDNVDVTFSDPNGNIVDGSVHEEWFEAEFATTTLDGEDRFFTYGPPRYSNKGWPIGVIGIRHGTRRVPLGTSPDWHDFNYVYSGFCTDCVYVQILINRNGVDYGALYEPTVDLPGPQDITGPNATWDVNIGYYTSVAWYVAIFAKAYLFAGPSLNPPPDPVPPVHVPTVPPQTTPSPGDPSEPGDPGGAVEGGEWGDIDPPGVGVAEEFRVVLI